GFGDVGPPVPQRVGHRLGYRDQRGAVDRGLDVRVLGEDPVQQVAVGQVTVVEDPAGGELDPAGLQVVEDHRLDAVVQAGGGDRAADVPGAAGDEDLHTTPPAEAPPYVK